MAQPPTKCSIVAQSRPFNEWPTVQLGEKIQKAVYALPHCKVQQLQGLVKVENTSGRALFMAELGLELTPNVHAQALNAIIKHTLRRYVGVIERLTNANERRKERHTDINVAREAAGQDLEATFEPKPIFKEDGSLVEPPGINPNLYCYSGVSPILYDPDKNPVPLPSEYADYKLPSKFPSLGNRLDIPKGEPGYVPDWQRDKLSLKKHRRVRAWYSTAKLKRNPRPLSPEREALAKKARTAGSVLAIIRIGEDWVVFDLRGSIRNARWRCLLSKDSLPKDILFDKKQKTGLLTGDPVIDTRTTKRNVVLRYRAGVTNIEVQNVKGLQAGNELLLKMTATRNVGLVAVDLGQTNPVAAGIFRVRQEDGQLVAQRMGGDSFWWSLRDAHLMEAVQAYRGRCDALEHRLDQEAIAALPPEQQDAFKGYERVVVDQTRQLVCQHLDLDPLSLPWSKMGSNTEGISRAYLDQGGDPSKVTFTFDPKAKRCPETTCKHSLAGHSEAGCRVSDCLCKRPNKAKSKTAITKIRSDSNWAKHLRPRLPKEVRWIPGPHKHHVPGMPTHRS